MSENTIDVQKSEDSDSIPVKWRQWGVLGGIIFGILLVFILDARMKYSDIQGYALSDSEWIVGCDNVGEAWQSFLGTDSWDALRANGDPTHTFLVELRKKMGIRLTPKRWNTWFGPASTLSGKGENWLLVTKPGALARGLDYGNRLLNAQHSDGVRVYNKQLYYRWEDGWLWCSNSRSLLNTIEQGELVRKSYFGMDEFVKLEGQGIVAVLDLQSQIYSVWGADEPYNDLSTIPPFQFIPALHDFEANWEADGEQFQVSIDLQEHFLSIDSEQ